MEPQLDYPDSDVHSSKAIKEWKKMKDAQEKAFIKACENKEIIFEVKVERNPVDDEAGRIEGARRDRLWIKKAIRQLTNGNRRRKTNLGLPCRVNLERVAKTDAMGVEEKERRRRAKKKKQRWASKKKEFRSFASRVERFRTEQSESNAFAHADYNPIFRRFMQISNQADEDIKLRLKLFRNECNQRKAFEQRGRDHRSAFERLAFKRSAFTQVFPPYQPRCYQGL